MVDLNLVNLTPQMKEFLRNHPNAYLSERAGMRNGIVRYHEFELKDPDQRFKTIGVGDTPEAALTDAIANYSPSSHAIDYGE